MLEHYHQLFIEDISRRMIDENWSRVNKCLDLISEEQLWFKDNGNVNSIGNLLLHLKGNLTQYICSGLFGEDDLRERDLEFSAESATFSIEELRSMFASTMEKISEKLSKITPAMLTKDYKVQGFEENGVAILIHVTEHLSYHVGQITFITKLLNNVDTGYYAGLNLNAKG